MIVLVFPLFKRVSALNDFIRKFDTSEYSAVTIVLSLDGGHSIEVREFCESVNCEFLRVKKIIHSKNLGLRKHIMFCASLSIDYEYITLLEDDIYLNQGWLGYLKQMSLSLRIDDTIDSISLYRYESDEFSGIKLDLYGSEDYLSNFASSWGQMWYGPKWKKFVLWLDNNESTSYPWISRNINNWSNKSWKKHYIAYLQKFEKYCYFPTSSYSYLIDDKVGTHLNKENLFFSSLLIRPGIEYRPFTEKEILRKFDSSWNCIVYILIHNHDVEATYRNCLPPTTKLSPYALVAGRRKYSIASWKIVSIPFYSNALRYPESDVIWGLHLVLYEEKESVMYSKLYVFYKSYLSVLGIKQLLRTAILAPALLFKRLMRR